MSPAVGFEPGWGMIFCCDGAGCGDICDPWCEYADPAVHERFIQSQHMGHIDCSDVGGPYHCDDPRCCDDEDDDL
jgi:hypothetical protein